MALNAYGLTDVGRKRKHNEDAYLLDAERGLFVVADGMGGHAAGEVASRLTVESIQEFIAGTEDDHDNTWPFGYNNRYSVDGNRLSTAVERANEKVMRAVVNRPELKGMGTTVVAALFDEKRATLVHVGDSRAYLLRETELRRLTDDHSWVQEQVNAGILSEDEARSHPLKNVVTRALGGGAHVAVDLIEIPVGGGDRFLLCSDGLTGMVSDEEITNALASSRSLEEIVHGLIDLANDRGGVDNITAIVVEVKSGSAVEALNRSADISREKTTVSLRTATVSDDDITPREGVEIPVTEKPAGEASPTAPEAPPEAPAAAPPEAEAPPEAAPEAPPVAPSEAPGTSEAPEPKG
ncbi:MAG: Stp1/IreP family PP2C-type Ser/Thr phosphatase [Holophagales bacterium]|nr:Stp1/IreP family PP2C-type Ser/Thr phosphatase [Holophagales bacterium]